MDEEKNNNRRKILFKILVITTAAVIFVPVLYSGIYLSSFWDPYGKFYNVPIAFVNLDKPYVNQGKTYNLGQDIKNNLKKNKSIGWKFVDYSTAQKGVKGTTYYAMVVIPEDFSKKIASAEEDKFVKPKIIYEANKGKNFVFAQVSQRAAESIRSKVSSDIQKEITKTLAKSLYDVKDSLAEAASAANKLSSGSQKLYSGTMKLSTGMNSAVNGSIKLTDGLKKAAVAEASLSKGIDSLNSGINQFQKGLLQNNDDAAKLSTGAKSLANGMSAVTSAIRKENASTELRAASDSLSQIDAAIKQASSLLSASSDPNVVQARTILNQVLTNMDSEDFQGRLAAAANNADSLAANLNTLNKAASDVSSGVTAMTSGISTTQSKALEGIKQLSAGTVKLKSGSDEILAGLNTAASKAEILSTGLSKLSKGAAEINSGTKALNSGNIKLKKGLSEGYDKINDNLTFTVEDIAKFSTNPLTLSDVSINSLKYYGEGLAPYFISLSLWLGAMLMNLILSLIKLTKIVENKFLKTYTGTFMAGSMLCMMQSLILSIVLISFLGIDTPDLPLFYLCNMFTSVVFFSIMYGVSYAIGIIGTPIMFVIFILQLASSGGTFPIETSPKFFRVISPYFPMTYSVEGLRMVTSGINHDRFATVYMILLIFMLMFYVGGFVINKTFKGLKNFKAEAE